MRICLVTPNHNGAQFLEKTILSVLGQQDPELDYVVVDGASSDSSLEIIDRYRSDLTSVISEPDDGHADAVTKGLTLDDGEIMGWINSDDLLMPGCLSVVRKIFSEYPDVEWITGRSTAINEDDVIMSVPEPRPWSWLRFLGGDYRHIQQESTFWRRSLWERAGAYLSVEHEPASDFELWTRFFLHAPVYSVDAMLGSFRFRSGQISQVAATRYQEQCEAALRALRSSIPVDELARFGDVLALGEPLQPSFDFPAVNSALAAIDPPVIEMDHVTGEFERASAWPSDPRPAEIGAVVEADLGFDDETAPLEWRSGPDLAQNPLRGLEVRLRRSQSGAGAVGCPVQSGPVAINDLGENGLSVSVTTDKRVVTSDPVAVTGHANVRVVLGDSTALAAVDGCVCMREHFPEKTIAVAHAKTIMGAGSSRWTGRIDYLRLVTRSPSGERRIFELREKSGDAPAGWPSPITGGRARRQTVQRLSDLCGSRAGERCVVMGNGPSLNDTPLDCVAEESVFACNAAFLLFDRIDWRPDYYACVDVRVLRDRAADISEMLDEHPGIKAFFPARIELHDGSKASFDTRELIPPAENRFYFNEVQNSMSNPPHSMFSVDAERVVVQPYTVAITMLQMANYLGFNPIYLIGCDTSYSIPKSVQQEGPEVAGAKLLLTSTTDDDQNHFDPRYFGAGREWHNPQVDKMIEHHHWARIALRKVGVDVFNATVGGQLEVYPRVEFQEVFGA